MERFPLPLGTWDGLRYFIVALPEPSFNYFVVFVSAAVAHELIMLLKNQYLIMLNIMYKHIFLNFGDVTRWTKQAFSCSKFLSPGGQLWANTAFEGSQFYSIGVPKFYSWVNVISVYAYNDLG